MDLQLIPLTTERATALAPSSYTSLVLQSERNTLSVKEQNCVKEAAPGHSWKVREFCNAYL